MEKPHKNQLIERRSSETSDDWHAVGIVTSVDGNICHYNAGTKPGIFIWRFKDGCREQFTNNTLHRWGNNPQIEFPDGETKAEKS